MTARNKAHVKYCITHVSLSCRIAKKTQGVVCSLYISFAYLYKEIVLNKKMENQLVDYKFDGHDTDIDECSSSPCMYGGTCVDGVDVFTCTCLAGYTGTTCETGQLPCLHFEYEVNLKCLYI